MIVDAHCHAWERWPYESAVPDPGRGSAEALIWEMDRTGVDRAVVICAAIGGNPDNNRYVCEAARSAGRLIPFVDADSRWLATHRTRGAAERLEGLVEQWRPRGVTHYMHEDGDAAWLNAPDGLAFLRAAERHRLILSLASGPGQMADVARAALAAPGLPILLHHLGRVRAGDAEALAQVVAAAAVPNLHVKLSGFGYSVVDGWDYPVAAMRPTVEALYVAFGGGRLVWGSDWPVSTRYMTHRQSMEIVRRHCPFIAERDMPLILGGTMERLLGGDGA